MQRLLRFKNYEKAYQRLGITEKEEEIFRATFADQTAADSAFGKDTRQQGSNKSDWDPDLGRSLVTTARPPRIFFFFYTR